MRRFPIYRQHDAMDCGAACLRMVSSFYGEEYSLDFLRKECHISRDGASLLGICDAAESIGMKAAGYKQSFDTLINDTPLPCIVHWKSEHFVVVYRIKKKRKGLLLSVADPAYGAVEYGEDEFIRGWQSQSSEDNVGVVLTLEPTSAFYTHSSGCATRGHAFGFRHVLKYLRPYTAQIMQMLLAMSTAVLVSMLLPYLSQAVVDRGILSNDMPFVVLLLLAQLLLVTGQMASSALRGWIMLHISSRVSVQMVSDFLFKLMCLPISFFEKKMVGDIMQRINDYNRIQSFLTGSLLSMSIAIVSFVSYGIIMAGYNLNVLVVFVVGTSLYLLWILSFMKRRRVIDMKRFRQSAKNQDSIIQLMSGMQDIKLNNCEQSRLWGWEKIQVDLFRLSIDSMALGQMQEIGGLFIDQSKNLIISYVTARAVIHGDMTLGMMMAVQFIMGQINAPVSQFLSFIQASQDSSISLDRVGELYSMEDEESSDTYIEAIPEDCGISFRDVVFQYDGPQSRKVLNRITLDIPAGKVTAIVGASGSGKTTLLKMILGFYKPVSGSVLLGEEPLSAYRPSSWRSRCGSVMQDGYLFSDTILTNIALCDESPDVELVRKAACVANIADWVESLPLGYSTVIGADGRGLSNGQKQRVLIARAVYKNPSYIFLDEATNSLDACNEKEVMNHLNSFFSGKTVVIVAHRLSTVKNADNIIVLDSGRIAESGSHADLVEQRGMYYSLIKEQLEIEK